MLEFGRNLFVTDNKKFNAGKRKLDECRNLKAKATGLNQQKALSYLSAAENLISAQVDAFQSRLDKESQDAADLEQLRQDNLKRLYEHKEKTYKHPMPALNPAVSTDPATADPLNAKPEPQQVESVSSPANPVVQKNKPGRPRKYDK